MTFNHVRFAIFSLLVWVGASVDRVAAQDALADGDAQRPGSGQRLMVITDDDFLSPQGDAWCARLLSRALQELESARPGSDLRLQTRFAGAPAILRGGRANSGPQRAICLLCDHDGKITAFCVGVPTGRQLVAMAEDADEVSVLRLADGLPGASSLGAEAEQQDRLVEALQERAHGRVLRHYKPLLQKIDRETSLAAAAEVLMPALVADRGERFLIAGPPDALRWLSAQQHTETMRHWCDAMLPSIVGRGVDAVWQELAAIVWDGRPWIPAPEDADFLAWYTTSIAAGPLILSVQSSEPLVGQGFASFGGAGGRNGRADAGRNDASEQTQRLLEQVPHRKVDLRALARLLHHRQDDAVDVLSGSEPFEGWAIFTSKQQAPNLIPGSAPRRLADAVRKLLAQP